MMMHSKKPILFLLSSFLLIFHVVNGDDPIQSVCSTLETYNASSQYAKNLDTLLKSLTVKVPPTGFGTGSVGSGNNRVTGLALCRGDASVSTCQTCVTEASQEILQTCRGVKEVVIWYENCFLKFSDQKFVGSIDFANRFYFIIPNIANNPALVTQKSTDLLKDLARKASRSSKLYATGTVGVKGEANSTIYGLTQCTRDLNTAKCKSCLDQAIAELPDCCTDRIGGRVVTGSCNIRYELYPFVNA